MPPLPVPVKRPFVSARTISHSCSARSAIRALRWSDRTSLQPRETVSCKHQPPAPADHNRASGRKTNVTDVIRPAWRNKDDLKCKMTLRAVKEAEFLQIINRIKLFAFAWTIFHIKIKKKKNTFWIFNIPSKRLCTQPPKSFINSSFMQAHHAFGFSLEIRGEQRKRRDCFIGVWMLLCVFEKGDLLLLTLARPQESETHSCQRSHNEITHTPATLSYRKLLYSTVLGDARAGDV